VRGAGGRGRPGRRIGEAVVQTVRAVANSLGWSSTVRLIGLGDDTVRRAVLRREPVSPPTIGKLTAFVDHVSRGPAIFQCNPCGESFHTWRDFADHERTVHARACRDVDDGDAP